MNISKFALRTALLAGPLVLALSVGAAAADVVSAVWVLARTSLTAEQVREINERSQYGYDLVPTAPGPVSPAEGGDGEPKKAEPQSGRAPEEDGGNPAPRPAPAQDDPRSVEGPGDISGTDDKVAER